MNLRRPGGPRKGPAHPGQVGLGKQGMRQVCRREIVQGSVQERLCESVRRAEAKTAGHTQRADPVQGVGALEGQAEDAVDGTVDVKDSPAGEVGAGTLPAGFIELIELVWQFAGQVDGQLEIGVKAIG